MPKTAALLSCLKMTIHPRKIKHVWNHKMSNKHILLYVKFEVDLAVLI
jgi:hypothetical protein